MEILITIIFFILLCLFAYHTADNGQQTNNSRIKDFKDAEERKESFKWDFITTWFTDQKERSLLIKDFNDKAQESFVRGETPTVLKASTSRAFQNITMNFQHGLIRVSAFKHLQIGL